MNREDAMRIVNEILSELANRKGLSDMLWEVSEDKETYADLYESLVKRVYLAIGQTKDPMDHIWHPRANE